MKIIYNQQCLKKDEIFYYYLKEHFISGYFINSFCWLFQGDLIFWNDTYFQLMASMRKMRIKIPLHYTPEMFRKNILLLVKELKISNGLVKISVFKNLSKQDNPSFIIELSKKLFSPTLKNNEIDIFKDILIYPNLLSSLYIFHPINEIVKQYAIDNDMNDLILLNHEKRIARSLVGNIFLMKDNIIYSPSTSEGAFLSPLKKNFILFLRENTHFIYREETLSPFSVQSSNEIFILSDEMGVSFITKSRKTSFSFENTQLLIKKFIGFASKNEKGRI